MKELKYKRTIKPCPYCGEKEYVKIMHILSRKLPMWFYIECDKCGWCGKSKLFLKRAIRSWNRDKGE